MQSKSWVSNHIFLVHVSKVRFFFLSQKVLVLFSQSKCVIVKASKASPKFSNNTLHTQSNPIFLKCIQAKHVEHFQKHLFYPVKSKCII